MAARGAAETELDDAELDAMIDEYKKMKDAGHLEDMDEDFDNHPFFMDHMPTVSSARTTSTPATRHATAPRCPGGGVRDEPLPKGAAESRLQRRLRPR